MNNFASNIVKYSIYASLLLTLGYLLLWITVPVVPIKGEEFMGRIAILFISSFGFFSSLLALILVIFASDEWLGNVADLRFQLALGCLLSSAAAGYFVWTGIVQPSLGFGSN